jgi:hypothetical protein
MAQVNPRRLPEWRRDRIPRQLAEDLAPGTVIGVSATNKVLVPILGARVVRIRAKVSGQATTLRARYVRPTDHVTEYAIGQPSDVALAAGTENIMDIITVAGEHYLSVQVVNGAVGNATVDFVDVAQRGGPA